MSNWRKCKSCGKVLAKTEFDDRDGMPVQQVCRTCVDKPPRPRAAGASTESVRKHREKTGNAYGKAYARARTQAHRELADRHAAEFAELLEKARIDVGLGPTRGT